jgi:hypothetical protein
MDCTFSVILERESGTDNAERKHIRGFGWKVGSLGNFETYILRKPVQKIPADSEYVDGWQWLGTFIFHKNQEILG